MTEKVAKRYINCFIASAEEVLFEGEVYCIKTKTTEGELEILPGHIAIMAALETGCLKIIKLEDEAPEQYFYISGGTLEVQPHRTVILANVGRPLHNIDKEAIDEADKWTREHIKTHQIDYQYVLSELAQTTAQTQMLLKARKLRDK